MHYFLNGRLKTVGIVERTSFLKTRLDWEMREDFEGSVDLCYILVVCEDLIKQVKCFERGLWHQRIYFTGEVV